MHERDVFIAALQLESRDRRRAYLDEACGDDAALRRHVEALLETHDRAGSFLEEPLLGPAATASSATDPRPEQAGETHGGATEPAAFSLGFLAPPQQPDELGRLGQYRVLRVLGQGGMGIVFLAEDTRLQRPVALKVMRPELAADPEGRQRFLREARAAANVRSEHVVTIHHVEQQGDVPFLVMEVLHGRSLAEVLEQDRRLPLGLCLAVARQTAEGLAAAHVCGLIHRDVKPSNVFLEGRGEGTGDTGQEGNALPSVRVKLLDFGLARARTGPQITREHVLVGTPAYMAPEQAAGRPLDPRSDLFSLGAILYRMLTGQQAFPGDDVLAVLSSLANVTPPPAASLVPGLPAGVAELLDRLLVKDPAGRPASAAEVARALLVLEQEAAGLVASAGQLPEPPGAEVTAVLPRAAALPAQRRRRLALAAGLGVASLAVVVLAAVLAGAFRGRSNGGQAGGPTLAGPVTTAPEPPPVRAFPLSAHPYGQVEALAFTADGKTLVSAELSHGEVTFWDIDRRERTDHMFTVFGGQLQSLAVDPQGRWLAVGEVGPDIHLFRFGEHVAAGTLKGHTDRVLQLAFLRDGRTLLSTGYDGSIRRWDVETLQEGKPLRGPGPRLDCLAVWEDRQGGLHLAVTGSRKDYGFFVSLDDLELERATTGPGRVALSPDGTRLACTAGGNGNGVALWDVPARTRLGLLPEAPFPRGLAFTPDGKHVVVMGRDDTRIYETAGGKLAARVDQPEKAVYGSLAVSPDGRWLAVGTNNGTVRVWHLPSLLAPPG
jgi:hypothetical protein